MSNSGRQAAEPAGRPRGNIPLIAATTRSTAARAARCASRLHRGLRARRRSMVSPVAAMMTGRMRERREATRRLAVGTDQPIPCSAVRGNYGRRNEPAPKSAHARNIAQDQDHGRGRSPVRRSDQGAGRSGQDPLDAFPRGAGAGHDGAPVQGRWAGRRSLADQDRRPEASAGLLAASARTTTTPGTWSAPGGLPAPRDGR